MSVDRERLRELLGEVVLDLTPEQEAWVTEAGARMAERIAAGEDFQVVLHEAVDSLELAPRGKA